MQRDLSDLRKNYQKDELMDEQIPQDPFVLFDLWFEEAKNHVSVDEVNAMNFSTISLDGFPKTRIVLLKEINKGHFIFYTNYRSEKAMALETHSRVCLHFFWPAMERQVIIKGVANKTSREKSEQYFKSRPRGSQLGAWASDQSTMVKSRTYLDERLAYFKKKFDGKEIPLPDFWGGYAIEPVSFEFWQGRPNRMHDRFLYEIEDKEWISKRLAP